MSASYEPSMQAASVLDHGQCTATSDLCWSSRTVEADHTCLLKLLDVSVMSRESQSHQWGRTPRSCPPRQAGGCASPARRSHPATRRMRHRHPYIR